MRRLILLRHGEAERRARGGGDLDRKLTARGTADAAAAGRALAAMGLQPSVALVSTATRTVETWEAVAPAFPNAHPQFQRTIYDAEEQRLWELFGAAVSDCVILVGHNPGIHNLAANLAQRAGGQHAQKLIRDFPPAAAAVFRIEAGSVTIEAAMFPNDGDEDRAAQGAPA